MRFKLLKMFSQIVQVRSQEAADKLIDELLIFQRLDSPRLDRSPGSLLRAARTDMTSHSSSKYCTNGIKQRVALTHTTRQNGTDLLRS